MSFSDDCSHVEVFTQSHCGSCRQVEKFLYDRDVAFTVRDVEADPDALDELISKGYMTTPVTRIGDDWVAGFKPDKLATLLAGLSSD